MYDMNNIAKLGNLQKLSPEIMQAFASFDSAVFKDGALSLKLKELIAVAVAVTTQCPYCIEIHSKRAKEAGASAEELAEATFVAAAIRAGGAVTHATHAI